MRPSNRSLRVADTPTLLLEASARGDDGPTRSAADKNLKLAVQTIDGLGGMPGGVPAGTGGQAATDQGASGAAIALGAGVAGGFALLATRRRVKTERA